MGRRLCDVITHLRSDIELNTVRYCKRHRNWYLREQTDIIGNIFNYLHIFYMTAGFIQTRCACLAARSSNRRYFSATVSRINS